MSVNIYSIVIGIIFVDIYSIVIGVLHVDIHSIVIGILPVEQIRTQFASLKHIKSISWLRLLR